MRYVRIGKLLSDSVFRRNGWLNALFVNGEDGRGPGWRTRHRGVSAAQKFPTFALTLYERFASQMIAGETATSHRKAMVGIE